MEGQTTSPMTDFQTDDSTDSTTARRPANMRRRAFQFSRPTASDGAAIYRLVRDGGTLELNSAYAYLLIGAHFGDTSVIARDETGSLCGFVWAYRLPERTDTLFVWQIGVSPDCRGSGLGYALLAEAIARPACHDATHLEATVTPSNSASMALFRGFGRQHRAPVTVSTAFETNLFPESTHEAEMLIRIGPFDRNQFARKGS